MKKITYILMSLCCLTLYSCGMTEPWKDWENEGNLGEDRLRPSEVKRVLCGADGWKMTYEDVTFYFRFGEEGTADSDSDEKILENSVKTDYKLDFQGGEIVLLTLSNGGMMRYLSDNQESTFVITGYSDTQIIAKGQTYGKPMTLVTVTDAEMKQAKDKKEQFIIAQNKKQAIEKLKSELGNGELRSANNAFYAHYSIACNDDVWKIKISHLDGKVLKHTEYAMTLTTSDDVKAVLDIEGLTVNGEAVKAIYFDYATSGLTTDNPAVKVTLNKSSDIVDRYNSSWKTHIVDRDYICDKFAGMPAQVEFDDRSPRHIVVCPGSNDSGQWHYIFFILQATADVQAGRVHFEDRGVEYLFGNYGDDAGLVRQIEAVDNFLNFNYAQSGFWMLEDGEYLYALSTDSDEWFRMKQ